MPLCVALYLQSRFGLVSVGVGALRGAIVWFFLKLARLIVPHSLAICAVALPIFLSKKLIIEKKDSKCTYLCYQNRADVLWMVVLSSSIIA